MGVQRAASKLAVRGSRAAQPTFIGTARPRYVVPGMNVYEAARARVRWLFDQFDGEVTVSSSGGKDSTVVIELALEAARERGRLPLTVTWLDQECEFEATVRYQRWLADRPEINFLWYQVPFRLFNATNHENPWLNVWGEGEEWMREKEPDSIHENPFRRQDGSSVDRFKELLTTINYNAGGRAILTGLRAEESPARRRILFSAPAYKWVTWSTKSSYRGMHQDSFMFHPICDWSYIDIWKAINDNGWTYNNHYDTQFRYGVPIQKMRVSNYHHETALSALLYLQEIEPQTWERATRRLAGINTAGQLQEGLHVDELPYMFSDWEDYLGHLIENLVPTEEYRQTFRRMHENLLHALPWENPQVIARKMVDAVLVNDLYGTIVDMFKVNSRGKAKIERQAEAARKWYHGMEEINE